MNWDIIHRPNIPTEVLHALHTAHKFFAQKGDPEWEVHEVASRDLVHSLRREVKELRAMLPPPSTQNRTEAEIPPPGSTIYIKVDGIVGSDVTDVSRDICALAKRLGINVQTNFNGIVMFAGPDTDHVELTNRWRVALARGRKVA